MEDTSPINPIRRMDFGEIYSTMFSLTRRTLPNAGLLIFLVNIGIVLVVSMLVRDLLMALGELMMNPEAFQAAQADGPPPDQVWQMIRIYLSFMPIAVGTSILSLLLNIAMIKASWLALNEEEITIGRLVRSAFSMHFWYIFGQNILLGLLMVAGGLAVMLVGALLEAITMGLGIGITLSVLALYGGVIYVSIAAIFGPHQIVINDRGPWKGLMASFQMVKGNWWRTFGMSLLLNVIFSVVIGLLSIPAILGMIEALSAFRPLVGQENPDPRAVGAVLIRFAESLPVWIAVLYAVGTSLFMLMWTNLRTAMFADLTARREDVIVSISDADGFEMR